MTPEEIRFEAVDLGSFNVPCDLVCNPGFLTNAVVDDTLLWDEMKKRLHKTTYNMVYKDCFEYLCPDYGDNSAISLKGLSQDKIDSNGNTICMTVYTYDTQLWNVTRHLQAIDMDEYGQDLCQSYVSGVNNQVKTYVKRKYPNFHRHVDTACNVQRVTLKVIVDHAYKGKQESISFGLNLKQHMPTADGATFVATVTAGGT